MSTHTPVDLTDEQRANLIAVPEILAILEQAADWFERYAADHYAKAKNAPSSGEQHAREVKGKLNRDRADTIRAAIAKATGYSSALAALNDETNTMVALSNGRLG